jgi:phospholipase A1
MKKLIFIFLTMGIVFPIFAQTNSGENKPSPEESAEGGAGEPASDAQVSMGHEKTDQNPDENESPFSLYKDTYLLAGYSNSALNKDLVFKFQISAKFRMPVPGIYLAYTQKSFMDVLEDSAPFTDHNFEPEIYYIYSFSDRFIKKNWLRSVQVGYRHGSNGLNGATSRSWERLYLETEFKHNGFYLRPTAWISFFKEPGNSDIERYWGYGELLVAHVWENDIRISGLLRAGTDWPKGSVKTDVTIPFALFFENPAKGWKQSNLWFQAFHGYGETFLGLKEASTAVAVGVGFRPDFNN